MTRPRKAELAAVVALLEAEHEDVETLAGEVISELFRAWSERTWFTVAQTAEGVSWAHGLYSTPGQAQKAVEKGMVPVLSGARAGVLPVYSEPAEQGASNASCSTCEHPRATHNWPKSKIKGCVIKSCDCDELAA